MDWGARASRPPPSAFRRRHQRIDMVYAIRNLRARSNVGGSLFRLDALAGFFKTSEDGVYFRLITLAQRFKPIEHIGIYPQCDRPFRLWVIDLDFGPINKFVNLIASLIEETVKFPGADRPFSIDTGDCALTTGVHIFAFLSCGPAGPKSNGHCHHAPSQ